MATINCPGGHTFQDNSDYHTHKFHVLPDTKFEELAEEVINLCDDPKEDNSLVYGLLSEYTFIMYKCPYCGRLLLESKVQLGIAYLDSYIKEDIDK